MAIEEPAVRLRLRRKLEDAFGVEEADLLMDRPPGGWSDLVTKDDLSRQFDAFEARILSRIDQRFAAQTWQMFAGVVALGAVLVAAVRL
jgi:hypothetical protein